jgi:hypothetical protein
MGLTGRPPPPKIWPRISPSAPPPWGATAGPRGAAAVPDLLPISPEIRMPASTGNIFFREP